MQDNETTLDWLKRKDREDAERQLMYAFYDVKRAQIDAAKEPGKQSASPEAWYRMARASFEAGLQYIERLADLNQNGCSTKRVETPRW